MTATQGEMPNASTARKNSYWNRKPVSGNYLAVRVGQQQNGDGCRQVESNCA
jgi:hypothetical protein